MVRGLTPFALLFPGQGAQFVGMGRDLAEAFPEAKTIFRQADTELNFSLSALCWEGPAERLTRTEFCQPALYTASMAALAALESLLKDREAALTPAAGAGLSLGEYTALAAGGALSFRDGLRLVHLRGQAMEEASRSAPGTMASVLGLDLPILEQVCIQTGAQVANVNCPGQLVISGSPQAVQAASDKAREKGAKRVVALEVGGAFHSRLMEPAGVLLRKALETVEIRAPRYPVLSNVTGSEHTQPAQIRNLLVEQLTRPVQWEACMRTLLSRGIKSFLEVGPGSVLKGLLRKIEPQTPVFSAGTVEEIQGLTNQV